MYTREHYSPIVFGILGLAATTQYATPGTTVSSATATAAIVPEDALLREIRVRCRVAPGAGVTDTWTVLIDGVASTAAAAVVTTALTGTWSGAVAVTSGEIISVQVVSAGGVTAAEDVQITLLFSTPV
jgi:hypothetical protein